MNMPNGFCTYCAAYLHELCEDTEPIDGMVGYVTCCCWNGKAESNEPQQIGTLADALLSGLSSGIIHRTPKDPENMRDAVSTGRKRAAQIKVIEEGAICEWAGLKNAGGGIKPVIGCSSTVLFKERGKYARHHGPDKNVINNEHDNLHLICPTCHNRWHSLNDPYYGDGTGLSRPEKGQTWLPNVEWKLHDPFTKASATDRVNNEIYWSTKKTERTERTEQEVGDTTENGEYDDEED